MGPSLEVFTVRLVGLHSPGMEVGATHDRGRARVLGDHRRGTAKTRLRGQGELHGGGSLWEGCGSGHCQQPPVILRTTLLTGSHKLFHLLVSITSSFSSINIQHTCVYTCVHVLTHTHTLSPNALANKNWADHVSQDSDLIGLCKGILHPWYLWLFTYNSCFSLLESFFSSQPSNESTLAKVVLDLWKVKSNDLFTASFYLASLPHVGDPVT